MARNFWTFTPTAAVALTAATAKTIGQIQTIANVRVAIQSVTVSFDGTSNTAVPTIIQLWRQTGQGTSTARNPQKKDSDLASTLQVTGVVNCTIEPTSDDTLLISFHVHPQAGVQYPLPLPGEVICGTSSTQRVGLKITAPANVNALFTMEGEE